jgi:hypothetical protein
VKSFTQWMYDTFDLETLEQISEHGCSDGIPGLIYYRETSEVYSRFDEDIWRLVSDAARENGQDVITIIGIPGSRDVTCHDHFAQLMVWAAAEIVAPVASFAKSHRSAAKEEVTA